MSKLPTKGHKGFWSKLPTKGHAQRILVHISMMEGNISLSHIVMCVCLSFFLVLAFSSTFLVAMDQQSPTLPAIFSGISFSNLS